MLAAIVINIDPTIVRLGHFDLRWYGLLFSAAIVAGVWLGLREGRGKGFDADTAQTLAIWAVVGGLIGARLFHVIDRWDLYASNPLRALDISQGGLAVYGGLIGGVAAGLVYALHKGLPVWRLGDAAAPGMLLGQAIGRLACIPNGDALGDRTDLPWAFVYKNPNSMVPKDLLGVPTQPYAAYELLLDLLLLAVIWRLRSVLKKDGLLFLTYAGLYSSSRFLLTFVRTERIWFWGLQEAQVVAVLTLVVALPLVAWRFAANTQQTNLAGQMG